MRVSALVRGSARALHDWARPVLRAPTRAPKAIPSPHRWTDAVLALGVLDREYLEAQAGRLFPDDATAVEFYLEYGRRRGYSLSPLIEPEWIESATDGSRSWFDFLHQRSDELVETGPLFDAGRHRLADGTRPPTTLGALVDFLGRAEASSVMPVPLARPGLAPTWASARAAALSRATAFADHQRQMRKRYRETWDGASSGAVVEAHARGRALLDDQRPLVSIVMPTFDRVDSLRLAVASVMAQTYDNWVLHIIDDGSRDGTEEYLREAAARDGRIRWSRQENAGAAAARNKGLKQAEGEFIAFLDSDNAWTNEFIEVALTVLLDTGAPGVHAGLRMTGTNGPADAEGPPRITYRGEDGTWDDLLAGNFIDLNVLVVREDAVRASAEFDATLRRWIDHRFVLEFSSRHGVPLYIDHLALEYDNVAHEGRISSTANASWQDVAVAPFYVDWDEQASVVSARDDSTISVVVPTYRDWSMTRRAVDRLLQETQLADGESLEVVVVDNGGPYPVSSVLGAWYGGDDRVQVARTVRNLNFALGCNVGFAKTTGHVVVLLNNDTEVCRDWLRPLVAALDDPDVLGAQSLLVYPDLTVQTAGTVFGGDKVLPWHFLTGHPAGDARDVGARRFRAVTAASVAFRAVDFVRWHGLDPIYSNGLEDVDLCLRAQADRPNGHFVVAAGSVVVHHEGRSPGRSAALEANRRTFDERWRGRYPLADTAVYAESGLRLDGVVPTGTPGPGTSVRTSRPVISRPIRPVAGGPGHGLPALRWAVKTGAGVTSAEVQTLRDLLLAHGQDVVVDGPQTWYRSSAHLDDVTVAYPGAGQDTRFVAQPGAVDVELTSRDGAGAAEDARRTLIVSVRDDRFGFTSATGTTGTSSGTQNDVETILDRIAASTGEER